MAVTIYATSPAYNCLFAPCTQVDVRSNNLDKNIGQLFIPIIDKPHFESFSGIPVKKIPDNSIAEINMKGVEGRKLEACGGVILAHCLKSNSSVTVVDTSLNNLGIEGGKALAECLKSNTSITQVRFVYKCARKQQKAHSSHYFMPPLLLTIVFLHLVHRTKLLAI